MPKFRNKPVVIEAMQFDGRNALDVMTWANSFETGKTSLPSFGGDFITGLQKITIETLEGTLIAITAMPGDFIIRDVHGEFYPCKPDIFEATYELVEE